MSSTTELVVKEVLDKGNGWFDVSFEDGTIASTKNPDIAEYAGQAIGDSVEAVINQVKTGRFTNTYLNAIDDVKDAVRKGATPRAAAAPVSSGGGGRDQERIARQWSYGRAVELLMASGREFELPLDSDTQALLDSTAAWLLGQTK